MIKYTVMKEHKHADVLRAIADGKEVQYRFKESTEWYRINDCNISIAMNNLSEWRIKPEAKKVDYQALIDNELLVSFYNMFDSGETPYSISSLKSYNETHYKDHRGNHWDCIWVIDDLRQVVSASALKKLILGGWDLKEILSYSESHEEDEQVVIILKGIQDGYTL